MYEVTGSHYPVRETILSVGPAAIGVITDSVACLPQHLVQKYAIRVVPLSIILSGRVYHDGVDITPTQVYEALKGGAQFPTTSSPSPAELAQVYQEVGQRASAILIITLSSKLGMVYNSAQKAVELAREVLGERRVVVLDSNTAAGAQGFVVLAAARAVAAGAKSLDEVVAKAQEVMPKAQVLASFDTLRYLAKGGRIGKAASWAGSILNMKPIIHVVNGAVEPLERPRSRARSLQRLLEIMYERVGMKPVHANLHHAAVPQEAKALKREIQAKFSCVEAYVTDLTPVMGVHTGPGTIAIAFYCEE